MNSWKIGLLTLLFFSSANAAWVDFPTWANVSNVFKLERPGVVNGVKIDTLVFDWPQSTGIDAGEVSFAKIDKNEILRKSDISGIYRLSGPKNLVIELIDRYGIQHILLGADGKARGQFSRRMGGKALVDFGNLIPMSFRQDIKLMRMGKMPLASQSGRGIEYFEFALLDRPLTLKNGTKANVLRFDDEFHLRLGVIAQGLWKEIAKDGTWQFDPNHTIRISENEIGTLVIDYTTGIFKNHDGEAMHATPLANAVVKEYYVPLEDCASTLGKN